MDLILDLEADPLEAATLATILADEYRLLHCPEPLAAMEILEREKPVVILMELPQRMGDGLELLSRLSRGLGKPPVIVIGPCADSRFVVKAVRAGAADYVTRPIRLAEIKAAIRDSIREPESSPFLGESPSTKRVTALIKKYAGCDYPVLILGESGTGKEVAAQALHLLSARRSGPFVPRNCAAIPEELIESELFGSAKGAFTGAIERPGAFELAMRGTLFLDEIGEACPSVQAKLLRVLESGDLWRLGDRKQRQTDIRLVSATSRNLKDATAEGLFRRDLFYRIDTLVLELPPLRERREDVAVLAMNFARIATGSRKFFSSAALERLASEAWPGNVRQLKNVVHRAIVLSGELEEIDEEHIVIY